MAREEEDGFEEEFAAELELIKDMDECVSSTVKRRLSFVDSPQAKRRKIPEEAINARHAMIPPSGPYIPVTGFNGRRVFVSVMPTPDQHSIRPNTSHQISTPISFLLESIRNPPSTNVGANTGHLSASGQLLWVDKYSPRLFQDLLSDERTNRNVLSWLKQWDSVVFGEAVQPGATHTPHRQSPKVLGALNRNAFVNPTTKHFPKAIILCGPPGLGKTTLAHVLARHAGYNPVEINASDDRTAGLFENKLLAAIQMRSVMGDCKPNCLIIDEIDGVVDNESKGAIDILVQLLAPGNEKGDSNHSKEATKKKLSALQRPIICICNDIYAPSLRRLRNIAQVFHFNKPTSNSLVSRLRDICKKEGLAADTQALTALVELTEHDIRSCIHTLQFARAQASLFTSTLLASAGLGQKDVHKGLFGVWKDIFLKGDTSTKIVDELRARKAQDMKNHSSLLGQTASEHKGVATFDRLYGDISHCNQIEKIVDGCFENYLSIMGSDHTMEKTVYCAEWMVEFSELSRSVHKSQSFELTKYLNVVPIAFNCKASATTPQNIQYPKTDYDMYSTLNHNKSILQAHKLDLPAQLQGSCSESALAVDIISPLMDAITPTMRAVNPQLLNEKERATLDNLVAIMSTYHLSYAPERTPNNTPSVKYVLDPPLDTFVQYSYPVLNGKTRHPPLSQQAIELVNSRVSVASAQQHNAIETSDNKPQPPLEDKKRTPQHKTPYANNAFWRGITKTPPKSESEPTKNTGAQAASGSVRFRFHEGFTNAVRRTVYVRDFL